MSLMPGVIAAIFVPPVGIPFLLIMLLGMLLEFLTAWVLM